MDLKMKQRLVGLLVVLALLAIFMPMIAYKMEPKHAVHLTTNIPNPPDLPKIQIVENTPLIREAISDWSFVAENVFESEFSNSTWAEGATATATVMMAMTPETPSKLAEAPTNLTGTASNMSLDGNWVVQLGSFSNGKNIAVLLGKLSDKGIPTFEEAAFSKKGSKMVRIFVGPLFTQNEAAEMKKQLKQDFHISGIIKKKTA